VLRWYAYDNWIVTAQGNAIVVKQGQPGGVLWFHPKVVDRTGFTTDQILPAAVAALRAGVQKPSLHAAQSYVTSITTIPPFTTTTTSTTQPAHGTTTNPSATTTTTAPHATTTAAP
jgi:hypothetical protein